MRSIVKCEETLQIGGGYCLENGYIWWPQYGEVRAPQHIAGWERCLAPCWSRFDVPLTHHYSGITEPWHIDKWMGYREAEIRLRHADEMMPADHRRDHGVGVWVCESGVGFATKLHIWSQLRKGQKPALPFSRQNRSSPHAPMPHTPVYASRRSVHV